MELTVEQIGEIESRSWHHSIDFGNGMRSRGNLDCRSHLDRLDALQSVEGKTVLDVGTRDGGLAFEFERRGARKVIANDMVPPDHFNFQFARACRDVAMPFLQADLYSLPFFRLPRFDIVNFSGVVYHVPDPILALMAMRELCREGGMIIVESVVLDTRSYDVETGATDSPRDMRPNPLGQIDNLLQYLPEGSVNSWVPSADALLALCRDAGLEIVESQRWGGRLMLGTMPSKRTRWRSFYQSASIAPLLGSREPVFL